MNLHCILDGAGYATKHSDLYEKSWGNFVLCLGFSGAWDGAMVHGVLRLKSRDIPIISQEQIDLQTAEDLRALEARFARGAKQLYDNTIELHRLPHDLEALASTPVPA